MGDLHFSVASEFTDLFYDDDDDDDDDDDEMIQL